MKNVVLEVNGIELNLSKMISKCEDEKETTFNVKGMLISVQNQSDKLAVKVIECKRQPNIFEQINKLQS